jgi:hypothetical protein
MADPLVLDPRRPTLVLIDLQAGLSAAPYIDLSRHEDAA